MYAKEHMNEEITRNLYTEDEPSEKIAQNETTFDADEDCELSEPDHEREEEIRILLIEPESTPHLVLIDNKLQNLQKLVEGYIEVLYPYSEPVALICNEEGKVNGLPLNRAVRNSDGEMIDIIAGNFLIAGIDDCDFCSLTEEQAARYAILYHSPEIFFRMGGEILSLPADYCQSETA